MKWLILAGTLALITPISATAAVPQHHMMMDKEHYVVHVKNFAYNPPTLRLDVGDTVKFINDDGDAHTVTATDKSFDSQGLDTGKSWSHTFKKAGKFTYYCELHPYMKAVIIVSPEKGHK